MPAFLEAWRAGLFRRETAFADISAGVVVGVVAIPLAMAFAIASGATPEQGLYTALVAGLIVTLLGGSRVQIAGPTGAFAVMLLGVTAKYGLGGLQVVTLLAGAILLLLGIARLGGVIRFIPESVVLGFTAGIAVVIWVGQWQNFFGFPAVPGENLFERLPDLILSIGRLDPATTALGLVSLLVVALWPKLPVAGKVPAPLVALVGATAFVAVVRPESVATIGTAFGGIPQGLPPFTLPDLSLSAVSKLIQPAISVALLGAIESLLSATVADGMTGTKHDPNQELIGQGLANIGASFFGGFAATGAVARTATNVRHGATSPLAGVMHAVVVLLFLLVLAPFASFVPLTTLAAVLFVVAFNMSQAARVVRLTRRAPKSDVAIMLVTLALSVLSDISIAVEVGVILSMLNFFRKMTDTVEVRALGQDEMDTHLNDLRHELIAEGTVVFTIEGPFFFGAVEEFESALSHSDTDPSAIVLDFVRVPFIDLSGLVVLKDSIDALTRRGIDVMLCRANDDVARRLERAGIRGAGDLPADASLADALRTLAHRSTAA